MKDLSSLQDQTLALGGILQACRTVHEIAQLGMTSNDQLVSAIDTVFVINPRETMEVYGEIKNVYQGLDLLSALLSALWSAENLKSIKDLDLENLSR